MAINEKINIEVIAFQKGFGALNNSIKVITNNLKGFNEITANQSQILAANIAARQKSAMAYQFTSKALDQSRIAVDKMNQAIVMGGRKATDSLLREQTAIREQTSILAANIAARQKANAVISTQTRNIGVLDNVIGKAEAAQKGFKMEWLGIMFAGMAIYRVFGGLIRQQMDLFGVSEGLSAMWTVVLLPIMEILTPIIWAIIDAFMNLPEGVQMAIGIFVLLAAGIGLVLMVIGQIALGVFAMIAVWGTVGPAVIGVVSGIVASLGLILIVVAVVIAIAYGIYLAWQTNFLKIRTFIDLFVGGIKQQFGGIIKIVKGILDIVIGLFTGDFTRIGEGIKKIFIGLWDFIAGGFKAMIGYVGTIVIGGIKVVYNIIKAVIDGLGWIIGKAGGLLGIGSGGSAFSMPSFQTGGIMPYTGVAYLHKGEQIIPANQVSNNSSPTINITANVSNDYDVRRLADQLKRYWTNDFERVAQGRSI